MIIKTCSPNSLTELMYKIGSDGIANVWIRKNENITTDEDMNTVYEYDETYFKINPQLATEDDIRNDTDFYFNITTDKSYGERIDEYSIPSLREAKHAEVSQAC